MDDKIVTWLLDIKQSILEKEVALLLENKLN